MCALKKALVKEESPYGRDTISLLIDNAEYAKKEQIACCHDTGTTVVIMDIGREVAFGQACHWAKL